MFLFSIKGMCVRCFVQKMIKRYEQKRAEFVFLERFLYNLYCGYYNLNGGYLWVC
jgi:hypothetical protein